MFTSRAEFRLHLRIDNADRRLTPHGRKVGLISDEAWQEFLAKQARQEQVKKLLETTRLNGAMLEHIQRSMSTQQSAEPDSAASDDLSSALGQSLAQLLKRPEVTIEHLVPALRTLAPEFFRLYANEVSVNGHLPSAIRNELKSLETEIKYEGYLLQQQRAIERLKKAEQRSIPGWFDYNCVSGLSREMQEKLAKVRPRTLAHASRIPGVTPAAVSLVNVYIEIQAKRREQSAGIHA
jgi:tRNA uridine 5-carboxymethylaminomethyl modification enzyme